MPVSVINITGDVIMWTFGIVFVVFGALVGVIWAQLHWRLGTGEKQARDTRQHQDVRTEQIFEKIDQTNEKVGTLALSFAEGAMTKAECDRRRAECPAVKALERGKE